MLSQGQAAAASDKVPVIVEVALNASSTAPVHEIRRHVETLLRARGICLHEAEVQLEGEPYLEANVESISVRGLETTQATVPSQAKLLFWEVRAAARRNLLIHLNDAQPRAR